MRDDMPSTSRVSCSTLASTDLDRSVIGIIMCVLSGHATTRPLAARATALCCYFCGTGDTELHVCIYVYVYSYIYIYIHTRVYVYVYIYIYLFYIHTYIFTSESSRPLSLSLTKRRNTWSAVSAEAAIALCVLLTEVAIIKRRVCKRLHNLFSTSQPNTANTKCGIAPANTSTQAFACKAQCLRT